MSIIAARKANVLIGCNLNARHTLWGCSDVIERDERLFDFIINTNILMCNRGSKSTFYLSSLGELWHLKEGLWRYPINRQWDVQDGLKNCICILFSLNLAVLVFYRNERIDWKKFCQVIRTKLFGAPNRKVGPTEEVEWKFGAPEKMSTFFKSKYPCKFTETAVYKVMSYIASNIP